MDDLDELEAQIVTALDGGEYRAAITAAQDVGWRVRRQQLDPRNTQHHRVVKKAAIFLVDSGHAIHAGTASRLAHDWMNQVAVSSPNSRDKDIPGMPPLRRIQASALYAGVEHRRFNHHRAITYARPYLHDLELYCRELGGGDLDENVIELWRLDRLTSMIPDLHCGLRRSAAITSKILIPAVRARFPLSTFGPTGLQMRSARAHHLAPLVNLATILLAAGHDDLAEEEAHALASQAFFAKCEDRNPDDEGTLRALWEIDRQTRPSTVRSRATEQLLHVAYAQWEGDSEAEARYTGAALAALQDAGLYRHLHAVVRRGWVHRRAA